MRECVVRCIVCACARAKNACESDAFDRVKKGMAHGEMAECLGHPWNDAANFEEGLWTVAFVQNASPLAIPVN